MNVRKFAGTVLATAWFASSAGIFAGEETDLSGPYTGPDSAVLTTAQRDQSIGLEGGVFVAVAGTTSSARAPGWSGWCGTPTSSFNGHDTAISSNRFADPFANGEMSFACHTY